MTDPEGTMIMNLKNDAHYDDMSWNGAQIRLLSDYNIGATGDLAYLGTGKGLRDINTDKIPQNGWMNYVSAQEHGLYILRYEQAYCGIYVQSAIVGTGSGIIGYTIKYCPFTPGKGWGWD